MSVENEYSKGSNNDRQREVKQGKGLFKDCLLAIAPSDQTRKQSGRIDGANYHDDRLERDYESDGNDGSRQVRQFTPTSIFNICPTLFPFVYLLMFSGSTYIYIFVLVFI